MALTAPFTDQVMWSITCGSKQHPYPDPLLENITQILHPGHHHTKPDGQPFYLELISQLANKAGDPDWQYPQILATGVPFPSPGVWPLKSELAGEDPVEATTLRAITIIRQRQTSPKKSGLPSKRRSHWA